MIYVGIDVAKDKHDCFITNSDGEVLFKSFTIANNREGFETLFQRIQSVSDDLTKVKVGLEATGHYSYCLLYTSQKHSRRKIFIYSLLLWHISHLFKVSITHF